MPFLKGGTLLYYDLCDGWLLAVSNFFKLLLLQLNEFMVVPQLRNTASTRQCSKNSQTFIPLLYKTEQYKNSFFSRTIKDWDAYSNNEILEL